MFENFKRDITIIEVGPRDGLQNEIKILKLADKIKYIELLIDSGFQTIEASSFVRAEKIPQMKDAGEISKHFSDVDRRFIFLVPNIKGLELALKSSTKAIAVFTATSETFNKKNINASISESIQKIEPVIKKGLVNKQYIRGYISTAFGCPYEGATSIKILIELCHTLFKNGVHEISIGDTIGVATPKQVKDVSNILSKEFNLDQIAMHFHDTRGMGVANCLTALECGISRFDSSSGGLGGCPYAQGATGNVATEDLVYLFESLGIKTGIDMERLISASSFILDKLQKKSTSKYYNYFKSSQVTTNSFS